MDTQVSTTIYLTGDSDSNSKLAMVKIKVHPEHGYILVDSY
jgi:hypothetical protein